VSLGTFAITALSIGECMVMVDSERDHIPAR